MKNVTKNTPKKRDWKPKFIDNLSRMGNVTLAAKGAGIARKTAYVERDRDPNFASEWDAAIEESVEVLEAIAWKRAKEQSDTLLIFLLKAHKPKKYRETTRHEVTGKEGSPLEVTFWQQAMTVLHSDDSDGDDATTE